MILVDLFSYIQSDTFIKYNKFTLSGVLVLKNVATGKVLDSNHGGNFYTHEYNNGNHQKWNVDQSGQGWANIVNIATGKGLDSNGDGNTYAIDRNGGDFQKWRVIGWEMTTFFLRNLATGRVLDSNHGGNVYTSHENGGNFHHWILFRP